MRTTFWHEDDFGMIELVPAENHADSSEQTQKAERFGEEHRDPGGSGWNDMYVIDPPKVRLDTLRISLAELSAALLPTMQQYDEVYTGYSTYRELMQRTAGWGYEPFDLFATTEDDDTVTHLCLNFDVGNAFEPVAAGNVILGLPRAAELILIDWYWDAVVPLADEDMLARYLAAKRQSFDETNAHFAEQRRLRQAEEDSQGKMR